MQQKQNTTDSGQSSNQSAAGTGGDKQGDPNYSDGANTDQTNNGVPGRTGADPNTNK